MAEPMLVASSLMQLPAISAPKARPKKVIIVRRTNKAAADQDSSGNISCVPTLPAIKQRASSTDSQSKSLFPVEVNPSITDAAQHWSDRAHTASLPVPEDVRSISEQSFTQRHDLIQDANPDEFGALILASTVGRPALTSESAVSSSEENSSQIVLSEDGEGTAKGSAGVPESDSDAAIELPADIAAAIEASEDGGVAIRDAYERRRQHRRELAMQASLLHQQQCEEENFFLASQRIEAGAETKAFEKWQQAQEEWERIKKSVMAQTGKPETDLVMERGPEFRAVKEAKEHLEAAKPTEDKFSGATMWEMSLRDHWTLSVPVGNIFGRIFPPACSAKPREIERIGRPEGLHTGTGTDILSRSRTATGTRTRAEILTGTGTRTGTEIGTRHRGWLDSEAVKERQIKLRKELQRLQPHEPEIDGLQVVGFGIEAGLTAAAAAPITLEEVEKELAASNNHAYTQLLEERARAAAAAASRASTAAPSETSNSGPALELAAERMTLCAAAGAVATEVLEVSNTGSTVLFYRWERERERAERGSVAEMATRGSRGEVSGRFYQMDTDGALRPGERKGFGFSFMSTEPGTWLETWKFVTEPKVASATELIIKGIAFEPEKPSREATRSDVEGDLAARIRGRAVAEAVDAIVNAVETPDFGRQETAEDEEEAAQELDFVRANRESADLLYYRPEDCVRASAISAAVSAIEERASKPSDGDATEGDSMPNCRWNGSIKSLTERLNLLGSAGGVEGLRQRLRDVTQRLRVPPSRRALLRRAMYVVLTSAADAIVDGVEAARDAAESDASARAAEAAPAAAAATESENPEEGPGNLEPEVELDEEVLRAQAEARERATIEEAIRRATSGAAKALNGLEGCLESAEREVCGQLDEKIRGLIQATACESGEQEGEVKQWEVFTLERQKQELLRV